MSFFEFFTATQAWASSTTAEHHAPSIHQIWFPLANFLLFAYIIKCYAVPRVREYLRFRREEVMTAIRTAAENKQGAEATVQHYRDLLTHLDLEVKSIQDAFRAEGEREKGKLLQEAERLAAKIKEDNLFLADQELRVARQNLREELANRAEAGARELIKRHLSSGDQGRLAAVFIENIRDIK